MAFDSLISRYEVTSNGSTQIYSAGFTVLNLLDIAVYVNGTLKTVTTHYTVANAGTTTNAQVTFTSASLTVDGDKIVFERRPPLKQTFNPANGEAFDAESLETTIDRLYHAIQGVESRQDRTFQFKGGEYGLDSGDVEFDGASRASKYIGFDSSGNAALLAAGAAGPTGDTGPTGAAGAVWTSGTAEPDGDDGAVGDFYLETDSQEVYKKTGASTWTLQFTIADGTNGTNGTNGDDGDDGEDGEDGATGAEGGAGIAIAMAIVFG